MFVPVNMGFLRGTNSGERLPVLRADLFAEHERDPVWHAEGVTTDILVAEPWESPGLRAVQVNITFSP